MQPRAVKPAHDRSPRPPRRSLRLLFSPVTRCDYHHTVSCSSCPLSYLVLGGRLRPPKLVFPKNNTASSMLCLLPRTDSTASSCARVPCLVCVSVCVWLAAARRLAFCAPLTCTVCGQRPLAAQASRDMRVGRSALGRPQPLPPLVRLKVPTANACLEIPPKPLVPRPADPKPQRLRSIASDIASPS